jgi:hypothetical protein
VPHLIGSTTVEIEGQDIDINDDEALLAVLRSSGQKSLEPIPPAVCKNMLLLLFSDIRLLAVKTGFVINQAQMRGSIGIGMETMAQIYNMLIKIAEMSNPREQAAPLLDQDGVAMEPTTPAPDAANGELPNSGGTLQVQPGAIPPEPPAAADEL